MNDGRTADSPLERRLNMVIFCTQCNRMISVSGIDGGNSFAAQHPDFFSTHFAECEVCESFFCDRCLPHNKSCPKCGAPCQIHSPGDNLSSEVSPAIEGFLKRAKEIEWLDLQSNAGTGGSMRWIGSEKSGEDIVIEKGLSGEVNEFLKAVKSDRVFRRAIIAKPEALETLQRVLCLPESDLRHSCMLALAFERGEQRPKGKAKLQLWGNDVFRYHTGLDKRSDLQAMLEEWRTQFYVNYGGGQSATRKSGASDYRERWWERLFRRNRRDEGKT